MTTKKNSDAKQQKWWNLVILFLVAIFAIIFIGFLYNAQKDLNYIAKQLRSDEIKNANKHTGNAMGTSGGDNISGSLYTTGSTTGELQ